MDKSCAICCEELDQNSIETPCGHHMHNNCLTHWLLLKDTCPICRFKIGTNVPYTEDHYEEDLDEYENEDDDEDEINNIELNFLNECYSGNYNTVLESLREIMFRLYSGEEELEDIEFIYDWIFDSQNNSYVIKLNTRNDIINIEVGGELFNGTLYLDVFFQNIDKKISKYLNNSYNKFLYISKYNPSQLPQRIECF